MAEVIKVENLNDKINPQHLIEFLEYEEALTTDKHTAARIRLLLKLLGIWS
jgi:hypothetical protein